MKFVDSDSSAVTGVWPSDPVLEVDQLNGVKASRINKKSAG